MSFTAYNAANLLAFILTDPRGVGLAALIAASPGQDSPIVAALNNPSGPGSGTVPREPIAANDFVNYIDGNDYSALNATQLQQITTYIQPGSVNIGGANIQTGLAIIFANYATTKATMAALATRPASPAEAYFGPGTVVTINDVDAARNSGSGHNF